MHFYECVVDFILTHIFTVCIFVFPFRKVKTFFNNHSFFIILKFFLKNFIQCILISPPSSSVVYLPSLPSDFVFSLCVFPEMRSLYERLTAPHTRLTIKYVVCNTSTFGCVLFHWSMASVRGTHLKEECLSFHQQLSVTSSCLAWDVWDILSTFSPCGDLVLLECVWRLCMLSQIVGVRCVSVLLCPENIISL